MGPTPSSQRLDRYIQVLKIKGFDNLAKYIQLNRIWRVCLFCALLCYFCRECEKATCHRSKFKFHGSAIKLGVWPIRPIWPLSATVGQSSQGQLWRGFWGTYNHFTALRLSWHQLIHIRALHCTALHCTPLHCNALHCCNNTIQYSTLQKTALHCYALICTVLQCTTMHCTALFSIGHHCGFGIQSLPSIDLSHNHLLQFTSPYCTLSYCTVLHFIVLPCSAL